jgi:thiol-disulfide isomerase/thioredoxin
MSARALLLALLFVAATLGCAGGAHGPSAAELSHPLVGQPAPAFTRERISGASFSPPRGSIVIVAFWATWSEPCKKVLPQLQKLSQKYAGLVTVVGLDVDDDASGIEEFVTISDVTFQVVWDEGKKLTGQWQPKTIPAVFLVDGGGVVRFVHLGYDDGEDAEIEKELKSLL